MDVTASLSQDELESKFKSYVIPDDWASVAGFKFNTIYVNTPAEGAASSVRFSLMLPVAKYSVVSLYLNFKHALTKAEAGVDVEARRAAFLADWLALRATNASFAAARPERGRPGPGPRVRRANEDEEERQQQQDDPPLLTNVLKAHICGYYIFCNIILEQPVGQCLEPVLRVIDSFVFNPKTECWFPDGKELSTRPWYVPVKLYKFKTISVYIRRRGQRAGVTPSIAWLRPTSFTESRALTSTQLTLHFKRIRLRNNYE